MRVNLSDSSDILKAQRFTVFIGLFLCLKLIILSVVLNPAFLPLVACLGILTVCQVGVGEDLINRGPITWINLETRHHKIVEAFRNVSSACKFDRIDRSVCNRFKKSVLIPLVLHEGRLALAHFVQHGAVRPYINLLRVDHSVDDLR